MWKGLVWCDLVGIYVLFEVVLLEWRERGGENVCVCVRACVLVCFRSTCIGLRDCGYESDRANLFVSSVVLVVCC